MGVSPLAQVFETLENVLRDDLAELSILPTAFVARGAIHSDVQTSAGSGVDAQALSKRTAGRHKNIARMNFIPKLYCVP